MVIVTEALRGPGPLAYFRALPAPARGRARGSPRPSSSIPSGSTGGLPGGRFLVRARRRRCQAGWPDGPVPDGAGRAGRARWPIGPGRRCSGGVAWLPTLPRVRLVIVGAGHVGQAVASLAAQADFDVWVVDDRGQYANAERFPTAQRILVGPIEEVLAALEVTPHTYALIVTRGHGHDQEALYHLAPTRRPLRRPDRQPAQDQADLREPPRGGDRRGRPGAGGRAGRPGHRLADRARDRHQHRRRADRPAQPGPERPGAPAPSPVEHAMSTPVTHDRRDRPRRRARAGGWAGPSCSCRSTGEPLIGRVVDGPARGRGRARDRRRSAGRRARGAAPWPRPPRRAGAERRRRRPAARPRCGTRSSWRSTELEPRRTRPPAFLLAPGDSPGLDARDRPRGRSGAGPSARVDRHPRRRRPARPPDRPALGRWPAQIPALPRGRRASTPWSRATPTGSSSSRSPIPSSSADLDTPGGPRALAGDGAGAIRRA